MQLEKEANANKEEVLPPKETFGEKLEDFGEGVSEVVKDAVTIVVVLGFFLLYGMAGGSYSYP